MLGTFGMRPKATMSARALAIGHALRQHGWDVRLGTTPWDWPHDAGRRWVDGGVRISNTHITRPVLWPLAAGEMIRWAHTEQPSLIHLFKPKGFGDLASRWLRRSTPVVVDMDDWEGNGGWNDTGLYNPLQRRIFDWQERTWPTRASALTVASRELEQRAIGLGAPVERVHYVPNGLTLARIAALTPDPVAVTEFQTRSLPGDGPSILLYTRFVEFDPASIADILAGIRARVPGTRLVIAGGSADGKAEPALLARARKVGCEDAIVQIGWIDPGQLGFIAGACDVAVHPFDDSRLNRAKSPVKLLELMATGIPVVTTGVGEATAFVENGASGLIAPPGNIAAVVSAVASCLDNPALRMRIGQAARERVARHFTWDRLVDRVLQAYDVGLASGKPDFPPGEAIDRDVTCRSEPGV